MTKEPTTSEIMADHVHSFRRAVYPIKDLKAGTILTEEVLTSLRPNRGIDAREWKKLIGGRLKVNLLANEKLDWSCVD